MKRLAFAIENNVGNTTYRKNLERFLRQRRDVDAEVLPIDLVADDVWGRLPGIRGNLALVGSARAASALHASKRRRPIHAALIHSQSIALFSTKFVGEVPTIVSTDATPANFDTLNEGYGMESRGAAIEAIKHAWTRMTFEKTRLLWAHSEWVKESFINDYGAQPEKVVAFHPGVDLELWKPAPELRPNDGIVRVLFVSGDFQRKGGDRLIRWIESTRHRGKVEIHMASKEPVPEVPGVVPHYGLTPNSPGLVRLAQQCDLFAFPTRADCSPWVLIEAQAAGLPGVSTRLGAIHEIVEDAVTGFLAPPDDEVALFECLDHLVEDEGLRARMSTAARERMLAHFDLRRNATRLVDMMHGIAA
jgi:glycosyltransferase involved in cell wall biosynthesis